ncbi:hypothetical protein A2U01_0103946, partial [Trifolium medium]|nr:hypothetical protein [Trifolium medium]
MLPRRFVEQRYAKYHQSGAVTRDSTNLSVNLLIKRFISKVVQSEARCESKVTLIST